MRKVLAFTLTLAVALTALAAVPATAAKNLDPCNRPDVITGGTYDNVRVPEGGTCIMEEVTVKGDFRADKAAAALIILSTVQGDVRITETPVALVGWSTVHGNVQFEKNGMVDELSWAIRGNNVHGDCEGIDNVGPRDVHSNIVMGNVTGQCKPRAYFAPR